MWFVAAALQREGIAVHRGARAARVESSGDGSRMLVAGTARIAFDRILVALGRTPRIEGLGLQDVGVALTDTGAVRVDDQMRTSGDRIWAAGDVTGQLYLTHVAAYHAIAATANALFHARQRVDHAMIPWVTFTDPEVARVGLTQAQARERLGRDPLVFRYDYGKSDRALTAAEALGFVKLVSDRRGRLSVRRSWARPPARASPRSHGWSARGSPRPRCPSRFMPTRRLRRAPPAPRMSGGRTSTSTRAAMALAQTAARAAAGDWGPPRSRR